MLVDKTDKEVGGLSKHAPKNNNTGFPRRQSQRLRRQGECGERPKGWDRMDGGYQRIPDEGGRELRKCNYSLHRKQARYDMQREAPIPQFIYYQN